MLLKNIINNKNKFGVIYADHSTILQKIIFIELQLRKNSSK